MPPEIFSRTKLHMIRDLNHFYCTSKLDINFKLITELSFFLLSLFQTNFHSFFTFYNIYMLFTGREGRIGKNCARGLEYGQRPQAEGRTRDRGHSFSQYGPTKAGE